MSVNLSRESLIDYIKKILTTKGMAFSCVHDSNYYGIAGFGDALGVARSSLI
jgi:hypothetical protein